MVLMTRQGRPTSECLLAIGVWALVWPFSRMNAAMSSKGAGIAEWLLTVSMLSCWEFKDESYLAATLAHMRLLTSVNTLVNGQSRALDELFPTVGIVADVWPDTTVNSFYQSLVNTQALMSNQKVNLP